MTDSVPSPRILIATAAPWPSSARLAHRLVRGGCQVSALCPAGHALQRVHGITRTFPYHPLRSLTALHHAITESDPGYIVPCTDGVVLQLHVLHQRHPELRPLLERSLGDPAQFPVVRSRALLLAAAQRLGIRVPRTLSVASEAGVHAWFHDAEHPATQAAVKVDGSWGGTGVKLASSEQEALAAYRRFARRPSLLVLLKRILVDHNPLALWSWSNDRQPGLSLQQLVAGRPANSMLACRDGKLLAALHVQVHCAQGPTKAAISIRRIDHPEMQRAAELLTTNLGLSGFFGLDYVLEPVTNRALLLELNPRATQIGHLEWLPDGSSVADILCAAWSGHPPPPPSKPIPPDALVLLFPQALAADLDSPALRGGLQDLPYDQPGLMAEFLNTGSKSPGLLQRLYQPFAKGDPIRPVVFTVDGATFTDLTPSKS